MPCSFVCAIMSTLDRSNSPCGLCAFCARPAALLVYVKVRARDRPRRRQAFPAFGWPDREQATLWRPSMGRGGAGWVWIFYRRLVQHRHRRWIWCAAPVPEGLGFGMGVVLSAHAELRPCWGNHMNGLILHKTYRSIPRLFGTKDEAPPKGPCFFKGPPWDGVIRFCCVPYPSPYDSS